MFSDSDDGALTSPIKEKQKESMPIPKQVLPKEGCLLLCATDEVSGEQLQIRVKANRINLVRGAELLESEDCQFNLKPEVGVPPLLACHSDIAIKNGQMVC